MLQILGIVVSVVTMKGHLLDYILSKTIKIQCFKEKVYISEKNYEGRVRQSDENQA